MSSNNPSNQNPLDAILADARNSGTWLACRKAARRIVELCQSGHRMPATLKTAFVSSFTVQPLVDFVTVQAAACSIGLETYLAPYGQISQELLNPQSGLYAFAPDLTILITESDTLAGDPHEAADQLIALARAFEQTAAGTLVVCTFTAPPDWPLQILKTDRQTRLCEANSRLRQALGENPRVQLCDVDGLAAYYGYANALSPQMQAMARIPFDEGFLVLLARKLTAHLKLQAGLLRKCLVLDCDNTLWGGIIGEDGPSGIALGPDTPGREFVTFQKAVLELVEQGVILAVNSKNNEADVLQVLRDHPHAVLREQHFAAMCINWDPKPENMKQLAGRLNIGLDSMVFADDNPAERELMRQMLPEVATLDLPANPALYAKALRETNFFARASLTAEDKQRGAMYAAQRQRSQLAQAAPSLAEYLQSLDMVCSIRPAAESDIPRAAQLTQRTNQFNLTTRRYTEADIRRMLDDPCWKVYVLGLTDKFGDNGTVGLALVETKAPSASDTKAVSENVWRIDTFLMSCRVIGRQAEDALLDRICTDAINAGAKQLEAEYIPTQKNALVADFWKKMNFQQSRDSHGAGITKPASDETPTRYHRDLKNYTPKIFEYLKIENRNQ
jgi:FkbH-like protein